MLLELNKKTSSKTLVENNLKNKNFLEPPAHLIFDKPKLEAKVINYCDRENLLLELDELLVIEYYSRR